MAAMTNHTGYKTNDSQQTGGIKERFPNYLRAYGAQPVCGVLAVNRSADMYRNFSVLNSGR